jgi:hypothetical protein
MVKNTFLKCVPKCSVENSIAVPHYFYSALAPAPILLYSKPTYSKSTKFVVKMKKKKFEIVAFGDIYKKSICLVHQLLEPEPELLLVTPLAPSNRCNSLLLRLRNTRAKPLNFMRLRHGLSKIK